MGGKGEEVADSPPQADGTEEEVPLNDYRAWHYAVSKVSFKVFLGIPLAGWLQYSCSAARQHINCGRNFHGK